MDAVQRERDDDDEPETDPEVDRALADYLLQLDAGEPVDTDALLAARPDLAEELGAFLATGALIDRMAEPAAGEREADRSGDGGRDEDDDTLLVAPLPRAFGPYELVAEIGRGGMGIVYEAWHAGHDRRYAVKVLQSGNFASTNELARFESEARAAMRLEHPNIVRVHEVGEVDGRHYLAMDLIEGRDLRALCRDNPLDARTAARILRDAAEALDAAHEAGILHRDIKPANILVDADGVAHLTDFGLAKELDGDSRLTSTGTAVGTPSYMSPEAARASGVDRRTDVYSLGAVLYAMLTGRPPFERRTVMETVLEVLHKNPTPPGNRNPRADRALEAIALKCLEKDPKDRYASARELADELELFLAGQPIGTRRIGLLRTVGRWLHDVPLVAALSGRVAHPSRWQRRVQWALVAAVAAVLGWALFVDRGPRWLPMPARIALASAMPGGEYHDLGLALAPVLASRAGRPVEVLATEGSFDNRTRLLSGEAQLALLQTGAIEPDEVSVVAPLYDDYVHVVARRDAGPIELSELAGRHVSIGLERSGMQRSATRLLAHFGVSVAELVEPYRHFSVLVDDARYVAAIVTTGPRNSALRALLASGDFELVSLDTADCEVLAGPTFRERTLPAGSYGLDPAGRPIPPTAIRTIATTTFLAGSDRASPELVTRALQALYVESDLVTSFDLIPRAAVAEWRMLDLHPAARAFFRAPRPMH